MPKKRKKAKTPKKRKLSAKEKKVVKSSKKGKKEWSLEAEVFDLSDRLEDKYDEVAFNLNEDLINTRVTTGSLTLDLQIGGGIMVGRWMTFYGEESSGKSTTSYLIAGACVNAGIQSIDFFDYENSFATQYTANIIGMPLEKIVGKKDKEGSWIVKPRIRHYMPNYGEKAFYLIAEKLKKLPDSMFVDGKRYMVFKEKQAKALKLPAEMVEFKLKKRLYVLDTGCPIKYVAFIDSFPEMTPQALIEKPDANPMAQLARMLNTSIPLVRHKLRKKCAAIIGVNHIRMAPMVRFGNPEYETGGKHLKHATDIRFRVSAVAIPGGKGRIEQDMSYDGIPETYAYTRFMVKKNKTFPKNRDVTLRLCIERDGESGYGIDPVYDLVAYLKLTHQLHKRGKKVKVLMEGIFEHVELTWEDLKQIVYDPLNTTVLKKILSVKETKKIKFSDKKKKDLKKFKKAVKNKKKAVIKRMMDLRAICDKQIRDKSAFKMAVVAPKIEEEEEEED